jgi:hypothetical protein
MGWPRAASGPEGRAYGEMVAPGANSERNSSSPVPRRAGAVRRRGRRGRCELGRAVVDRLQRGAWVWHKDEMVGVRKWKCARLGRYRTV